MSKPLAQVRKELRVEWYRSPLEPTKLRELMQRSDLQAWWQAGGHLALVAGTGVLTYLLWQQQSWAAFALLLFIYGTFSSFLPGAAVHELGHGTVFRTRWLNKLFLYVFSLPSWWNPFDYALSHTYHHRYTLHPEGDREVILPLEPTPSLSVALTLLTISFFSRPVNIFGRGGLFTATLDTLRTAFGIGVPPNTPARRWLGALRTDQAREVGKARWWARAVLLFHMVVVVVAIVTGLWVLPILLSIATFVGPWWLYAVGMTQHTGLRNDVADFRKCVRSVRLDPLSTFLYWRMNWHTEHHMYAGVPSYNLKKLSREIAADLPAPRTLLGAWREMREIRERQRADPTYQFDVPLPATARNGRTSAPTTADDRSVGDLAPGGLTD
jgi:fatty acid desaturase